MTEKSTLSGRDTEMSAASAFTSIYTGKHAAGGLECQDEMTPVDAMRRDPYAPVVQTVDENGAVETAKKTEPKLGLLWGVYLPCVQNILGVILFIRLPWIAAQAGLPMTTLIILMCVLSTLVTSLSLSAIATNGKIMAGGPYYVISRNLGVEVGAAIGFIFYLGTTLAASMYILGAVEAIQTGFGLADQFTFDSQLESIILAVLLATIVSVGVKYVNMSASFFLLVVFISIFSAILGCFLYLGGAWRGDVEKGADVKWDNMKVNFEPDEETNVTPTFFSLIALFYPSVTGIMAGSNRSGVLADPGRHIPIGTIGAILTTLCIYLVVVWLMGSMLSNEYLKDDKLAFASIAWPPVLVNIGIVMSSVGAALQSLTGAPRLLSAIANDGVIPFLNPFKCPGDENPIRSVWLTWFICALPCLAGNLDYIVPIVTMFFLTMYSTVNFACFILSVLKSPGFRPKWKYFSWHTALFGTIWCLGLMFIISWWTTLIVFLLAGLLFAYIYSKHAERDWGDSVSGFKFLVVKSVLQNLSFTAITHAKNWRPQLCVVFEVDENGNPTDKDLLRLGGQMKKGRGLAMFVGVRESDPTQEEMYSDEARLHLSRFLEKEKISAFSRVIVADNRHQAFCTTLQTLGIGALRPNTALFSWFYEWREDNVNTMRFVRKLKTALARKVATIVYKQDKSHTLQTEPYSGGFIDIWWVIHDGGLLLLLPYLLTLHRVWRQCTLRLFAVTMTNENPEDVATLTAEFLNSVRIDATVEVISLAVDTSDDMMSNMSSMRNARMNFEAELASNDEYLSSANVHKAAQKNSADGKVPMEKNISEDQKSNADLLPSGARKSDNGETAAHVRIRLRSVEYTFAIDETQMRFAVSLNKLIIEKSSAAHLVVTNLPIMPTSMPTDFMSFVDTITKGVKSCLLVRGSGDEVVTKYG